MKHKYAVDKSRVPKTVLPSYIKDRKNKEAQFKKFSSKLSPDGTSPDKELLSTIRGAIRKSWMRHPTKLSFLAMNAVHSRELIKGEAPDGMKAITKWLYKCSHCDKFNNGSAVEVDHIKGEHTLLTYDDVAVYAKSILGVSWEDLQILCKTCHGYKTYSERYGISIEEAKVEKGVISLMKRGAVGQRAFIRLHGIEPSANADGRRNQIRDILLNSVKH